MNKSRERLIDATFEEIFQKGYSGASLGDILKRAGVKKGSLYHHFASKKELVMSMIREKFIKRVDENWCELCEKDKNIIDFLLNILKNKNKNFKNGCPLGNVLQECSNLDDDFIRLMDEILKHWENIFQEALNRAIVNKEIKDVDSKKMSLFLIAIYEGAILMSKRSKSAIEYDICINQLEILLDCIKIKG